MPPPRTDKEEWLDDVQTMLRLSDDLNDWERNFLENMESRLMEGEFISDKMWVKLEELWDAKL